MGHVYSVVDKWSDCAKGRVQECWIVGPLSETITVLRLRADAHEEQASTGAESRRNSTLLVI